MDLYICTCYGTIQFMLNKTVIFFIQRNINSMVDPIAVVSIELGYFLYSHEKCTSWVDNYT